MPGKIIACTHAASRCGSTSADTRRELPGNCARDRMLLGNAMRPALPTRPDRIVHSSCRTRLATALLPAVSTTLTTSQSGNDARPQTLGDVLYANPAKVPVSEAEWVALVQAIAAGDQLALHSLYGRVHRLVFTLAMRIVRCRETAEEITVDVFHQVWRKASSYDAAGGTVVGWIMNQARSRALDRLRFEHRRKRTPPPAIETLEDTSANASEATLDPDDRNQLLHHAISTLTPHEREAIETAFFSEFSYFETAARLRQPVGTIKTRIRSGLAKLRHALAAEKS